MIGIAYYSDFTSWLLLIPRMTVSVAVGCNINKLYQKSGLSVEEESVRSTWRAR
jgi:hypothetical protein